MALFTDADIVTLEDLLPFEGSLVQVASAHGINVDTKISAREERSERNAIAAIARYRHVRPAVAEPATHWIIDCRDNSAAQALAVLRITDQSLRGSVQHPVEYSFPG